jgi:mannitol-1-/sugar-/sorbitol-6-phosphatase
VDILARGVLFDMDGTLVDSTAVVEAAWTRWGGVYGIDPATILAFSHGRQTIDTVTHFLPDLPETERRRIADELVADEVERTDGIVEIPGAGALVRSLVDAGVPVALVTSAPRDLALNRMRAAGVPVPTAVVTSEDVERGKPDPECFLRGAALLGLDAADCVAFEDAEAGLAAAVASGAHVVVVGGHDSDTTAELDRVADHSGVTVTVEGERFRLRA